MWLSLSHMGGAERQFVIEVFDAAKEERLNSLHNIM